MWLLLFFSSPSFATVAEVPCPTTLAAQASVIVGDLNGYQPNTDKSITDTESGVTDVASTDSIFP